MSLTSYLLPLKSGALSYIPATYINHTLTHSLACCCWLLLLPKPFKCNTTDNLRQISFINIMPRAIVRTRFSLFLFSSLYRCCFTWRRCCCRLEHDVDIDEDKKKTLTFLLKGNWVNLKFCFQFAISLKKKINKI